MIGYRVSFSLDKSDYLPNFPTTDDLTGERRPFEKKTGDGSYAAERELAEHGGERSRASQLPKHAHGCRKQNKPYRMELFNPRYPSRRHEYEASQNDVTPIDGNICVDVKNG